MSNARESFLKPFNRRYKRGVRIPFVPEPVTLGNVNERERQSIIKRADAKANEGKSRAFWFLRCVYEFDPEKPDDPNPPLLFKEDDIDALATLDSAVSSALMSEISKHCFPDEPTVEDLEKNSAATASDGSPSS